MESDQILIEQIRAEGATSDAWNQLVTRYEGRLRAFVRNRLRDDSICDDIVQDTFTGFFISLANYDEKRELQTWLFTIAAYKITDQLRKMGRQKYQAVGELDEEMLQQEADRKQRVASSIARGQEKIDLETQAIQRALREITEQHRLKGEHVRIMVLELLFVKSWPNFKVAEFLDVTEQQVANYRHATVKKLTQAMRTANLDGDIFPELSEDKTSE